jgi:hypothetical protein
LHGHPFGSKWRSWNESGPLCRPTLRGYLLETSPARRAGRSSSTGTAQLRAMQCRCAFRYTRNQPHHNGGRVCEGRTTAVCAYRYAYLVGTGQFPGDPDTKPSGRSVCGHLSHGGHTPQAARCLRVRRLGGIVPRRRCGWDLALCFITRRRRG